MNKKFILANFKSYKTQNEALEWLNEIKNLQFSEEKEVIVFPPFTLLSLFKDFIENNKLNLKVGAQNISPFDQGAYTGEINGKQIKEFADYVLIGHSERRSNFNEKEEMLANKVSQALEDKLTPIFLIQGKENTIPTGVELVAYEPVFAIGTGSADTPENAGQMADYLKTKNINYVLYGGSVTSENVSLFTTMENISGVLVGGASLNASEFIKIVENA